MDFLGWLRVQSSARRAQRLKLGVVARGGRLLSAKTCNRVMAAVSSFLEFLIAEQTQHMGSRKASSITVSA